MVLWIQDLFLSESGPDVQKVSDPTNYEKFASTAINVKSVVSEIFLMTMIFFMYLEKMLSVICKMTMMSAMSLRTAMTLMSLGQC